MEGRILYYPIFHDPTKPGAERSDDVRDWVERILIPAGRATYDKDKANCLLVATGDGGLMRAARAEVWNGSGRVIFGVNRGRRGFLLNPVTDVNQLPRNFSELDLMKLKLILGEFFLKSGKVKIFLAISEIALGRSIVDYIAFKITGTLGGLPDKLVEGTGLVVATPQGTTGYTLKNGGEVLPLDSPYWYISGVVTGPYPRGKVPPQRITIEVEARRPVNGYADGYSQEAKNIKKVVISPTNYTATLGFLKTLDFPARRLERARQIERGE